MSNAIKCQTDLSKVNIFGSLEGIAAPRLEELKQLYLSHARVTGFSIKKWTQRIRKNVVVEKYLVCSCEEKTHHVDPSTQHKNILASPKK